MKKFTFRKTIVKLVFINCVLLFASQVKANDQTPPFEASIQFDKKFEYYYVKLENNSPHFLCIDTLSFDTTQGFISLTDMNGKRVFQRSISDDPIEQELGFNFHPSYLILRPGEKKREAVDMNNFEVMEGKYHYNIIVGAYVCKDVVDESRVKEKREVKGVSIQREGIIEFNKKFIQLNEASAAQKNKATPINLPAHEATHKVN